MELYRSCFVHWGHGTEQQAVVGIAAQVFVRKNSQQAIDEYRPYYDESPLYKGGAPMEVMMKETPLLVGSPNRIVDRIMHQHEIYGDYARQMFLVDHGGLPKKTVM